VKEYIRKKEIISLTKIHGKTKKFANSFVKRNKKGKK